MNLFLNKSIKKNKIFLISFIFLLIIILISLFLGTVEINFIEIIKAIIYKFLFKDKFYIEKLIKIGVFKIIFNLRAPRIINAALIGASLSVIGAVFQGLFRNQMADPFIIGVSSGGALGATIGIILSYNLFFNFFCISSFAFFGAILTLLLIITIIGFIKNSDVSILLLIGMSVNFFSSACISILMFMNNKDINKIIFWNMGTLSHSSWEEVFLIFLIMIIVVFCFYLFRRELNVLTLGEEQAKSLGISVYYLRIFLIILSSLLIGIIVSVSGTIGFVGLIIPNIARLIVGANYKNLIPFSIIFGAIFLVFCDTLARLLLLPIELPVGAITAIFGTPFFIFLLIHKKRKKGNNIYD